MYIEPRQVHDLKTERPEIAPPLPVTLRIVPLGFYLAVAASIGIAGYSMFQIRQASAELDRWNAQSAATQTELNRTKGERASLESRAKRASDFVNWVEGSRNLQPLVATICRSIGSRAAITELALAREDKAPFQIKVSVALQTDETRQLDATLEEITRMNFRPYSAQQRQSRDQIDYEATLIWQGAGGSSTPPAETPPAVAPPTETAP